MSIETMMCLSTAHVSAETARQLEAKVGQRDLILEPGKQPWVDTVIAYDHGEYGWLIAIADSCSHDDLPEDLAACLAYAILNGCEWLLLDRDAELVDELPSFDW